MRIVLLSAALAPFLLIVSPASANDKVAAALAAGAYDQAESAIQAELRIHPGRPELLLNLAVVYANTGREAQARTLYTQVLTQREVLMDVRADKVASSHAIATHGLQRIQAVQLSAR